jgi:competence protein ComEA
MKWRIIVAIALLSLSAVLLLVWAYPKEFQQVSIEIPVSSQVNTSSAVSSKESEIPASVSSAAVSQINSEATEEEEPLQEGSISLNKSDVSQLERLPGIGPVLAQRIVDYRTECGSFYSLEELMDVEGIGEKTFEKIKPYLVLD